MWYQVQYGNSSYVSKAQQWKSKIVKQYMW